MRSETADGSRHRRNTEGWNDLFGSHLAAADLVLERPGFSAELMGGHLGQIELVRLTMRGQYRINRTVDHIDDRAPKLYSILYQKNGRGLFAHRGHEVVLREGDFAVCNHAEPYRRKVYEHSETILVRVPEQIFLEFFPYPDLLCGLRLPAGEGVTPTLMVMTCNLWRQIEQKVSTPYDENLVHQLLDLSAISYNMVFGSSAPGDVSDCARRRHVLDYVHDHLRDPALSIGMIAQALSMSSNDVWDVFAGRNDTPRGYILRCRLNEVARQLRDHKWRGSTVGEIAFSWGFASAAHFTRAFRSHYGASPTEYRGKLLS